MKKIWIIILMLSIILTGCTTQTRSVTDEMSVGESNLEAAEVSNEDPQTYISLFEDSIIHEIRIVLDEEDWISMLENPLEEEFYSANLSVDGYEVSNVGFRTKGNSTLRDVAKSESDRYSFKFKVNKYEDQKLMGLDEFVINNMFSDGSYMREYISYEAMATVGSIVPETSYANVYVNDDLIGFYLMVETIDDSFLSRSFGNNDGNLYRMDQGSSLLVEGATYYENGNQKNGDDESKSDLNDLMDILNAMPDGEKGDIETVLDVDSALRYIAANTILESYDSLSGKFAQNYYLYNNQGVFTVIPWDYNMSFGTFGGDGTEISIDTPVLGRSMEESPLIQNLLEVEEYKNKYYDILESFIVYFEDFESKVAQLKDKISNSVEADPSKFTSYEIFDQSTVYQENGASAVGLMNEKNTNDKPLEDGERPPMGTMTDERSMKDGKSMKDGRPQGNNMMAGNDVSIINIIESRIESIQSQLSNKE